MTNEVLIPLATSAAVGALVSSMVTFFGQHLERRARRRELFLKAGMDLAFRRTDLLKALVERSPGCTVDLKDDVSLTADYFRVVSHLFDKGSLPPDFLANETESSKNPKIHPITNKK